MSDFIVYYHKKLDHYDMHHFINEIALYVENKHNAKLIVFETNEIINIGTLQFEVWDCEIIFYWPNEDILKSITFADLPEKTLNLFYKRNNKNDVLIAAQIQKSHLTGYPKCEFKLQTCGYLQSNAYINLDLYYDKRKDIKEFKDTLVFRGNVKHAARSSAELLTKSNYFVGPSTFNVDEYFDDIINCKVGLSIPGVGEKCHRDVEYMAIGLPFIKFKYLLDWEPKLIPNYHYISIDRIDDSYTLERIGGQPYVDMYLKKFIEIKDNIEYLEFVSNNARLYYEKYLHPKTRVQTILEKLNL
jgi:hypothetical protein